MDEPACHACGEITDQLFTGRHVIRSGRDRQAIVRTSFCRTCAEHWLGLRLPPILFPPLTAKELYSLELRASAINCGSLYFRPYEMLRLIYTIRALTPEQFTNQSTQPALARQAASHTTTIVEQSLLFDI